MKNISQSTNTHIYPNSECEMKVTIKVVNQPHGSIWVTNHAHSVYEGENWFKSDQTELNTIFFPTQEMLKNYLHNLIEVASQSLAEMSVEA